MHSVMWNQFPIKNLLIDLFKVFICVETTYFNSENNRINMSVYLLWCTDKEHMHQTVVGEYLQSYMQSKYYLI